MNYVCKGKFDWLLGGQNHLEKWISKFLMIDFNYQINVSIVIDALKLQSHYNVQQSIINWINLMQNSSSRSFTYWARKKIIILIN